MKLTKTQGSQNLICLNVRKGCMKIEKADKRKIKEIAKLMLEEFKKPPFNEKVSLNAVLKSLTFYFKIGNIYVALEKDKTIGVLVFKIEQYWEGAVLIIEDLAVKEEFKRKGVGKMLMNYVEVYAKRNRLKRIIFKTNKKAPAIKFYEKIGYKARKDIVDFEKKIN